MLTLKACVRSLSVFIDQYIHEYRLSCKRKIHRIVWIQVDFHEINRMMLTKMRSSTVKEERGYHSCKHCFLTNCFYETFCRYLNVIFVSSEEIIPGVLIANTFLV